MSGFIKDFTGGLERFAHGFCCLVIKLRTQFSLFDEHADGCPPRNGKPADAHYADLHPMGNYFIMAMGHVLPVPANTVWDPDVLKLPVASSYMRPLNAAQYARLQVALREAQARKQPYWNAITNNCNHFIGELAQAVGLRVPSDFQLSYMFVRRCDG